MPMHNTNVPVYKLTQPVLQINEENPTPCQHDDAENGCGTTVRESVCRYISSGQFIKKPSTLLRKNRMRRDATPHVQTIFLLPQFCWEYKATQSLKQPAHSQHVRHYPLAHNLAQQLRGRTKELVGERCELWCAEKSSKF